MLDLQDQFAGGPLTLADHASGTAVVAVGDGTMTITVGVPPAPLTWLLSGGVWNDTAPWNDAALWEDS